MKPFLRQPHPVAFTAAAMAVALVVVVLASMSVGRGDTVAHGANVAAGPKAAAIATTEGGSAIRPFRVSIPETALVDLRRRIAATRWPEQETVADRSQGVQLTRLQTLVQAPRSWGERAYPNLLYFHEVDRGGHFAAWEEPDLFAAELRAAFKPLRTFR